MSAPHDRVTTFERYRPRLFGLAYRMLGAVDDAEDVVQEAYLRWHQADLEVVHTPEAWLVAVTSRLAIDRLRKHSAERAAYDGIWLPEPIATDERAVPDFRAELASDLSMAFLVLLERLSPEERAALLLRDVFDWGYDDIGRTLERSEAACRQLVHRARERVRRVRPRFPVPPEAERLLGKFLDALSADDERGVLSLLADDASFAADGGGKVPSVRRVVRGAHRVARLLIGYERKGRGLVRHHIEWLNGEPAIVTYAGDRVVFTTSVDTDGERIYGCYRVLDPQKLRRIERGAGTADA